MRSGDKIASDSRDSVAPNNDDNMRQGSLALGRNQSHVGYYNPVVHSFGSERPSAANKRDAQQAQMKNPIVRADFHAN